MTIANELSSEVAVALLEAHKQGEHENTDASNIRDVIVAVHATLRKLEADMRRAKNQSAQASAKTSSA